MSNSGRPRRATSPNNYRLVKKHLFWDTELASKKVFSKNHSLEKGAVFSAIASAWMTERYEAPSSSRSSSANAALAALAAADLSSTGSSPLPRRLRPPTSPPLQENPMQTQWTRGLQPHSFQKRARATLARLELAALACLSEASSLPPKLNSSRTVQAENLRRDR